MGACCEAEQETRPEGVTNAPTSVRTADPKAMGKPVTMAVKSSVKSVKRPREKPLLIYFPIHGKGEPIRMLANFARVDFEDKRVTFDEFANLKKAGKLPAGQVPLWIDTDGTVYNQTNAIMFLIARQTGLWPSDPLQQYNNEWAGCQFDDLWKKEFYGVFLSGKAADMEKEKAERVEKFTAWIDLVEQKMESIQTEFLNGDRPGAGDFLLFSLINLLCHNSQTKVPDIVDELRFTFSQRNATYEFYERVERCIEPYMQSRTASHM